MQNLKKVIYILGGVLVGISMAYVVSYAIAFTEPGVLPPGGNVSAPLNVSGAGQTKAGGLILGTNCVSPCTTGLIVDKGNVGIGTVTPETKLHVVASLDPIGTLNIDDTTSWGTIDFRRKGANVANWGISPSGYFGGNAFVLASYDGAWTDPVVIEQGAPTGAFYVKSNGNVGIGTTGPEYKLEVSGDVRAMGDISATNIRGHYLTRALPVTANDYVEIGKFTITHSGHSLDIAVTVTDSGFSVAKRYILPVNYDINSNWQIALPVSDTGSYAGNNFDLDVKQVNGEQTAYLRLRRTTGTTAGTAIVQIQQRGNTSDTFTAMTGTGTTTAPSTFLSTTALTQVNSNVGIGTAAPSYRLDAQGQINASNGLCIGGDCKASWGDVAESLWSESVVNNALFPSTLSRRVGIGVANPAAKLEVSDGQDSLLRLTRQGGVQPTTFRQGTDDTLVINNNGTDTLALSSGKVGIGLTSPSTLLEIKDDNPVLTIEDTAAYSTERKAGTINFEGLDGVGSVRTYSQIKGIAPPSGINNAGQLGLFTRKAGILSERVRIDEDGNVGIGTAAPSYRLDAQGQINASNGLCIGGDCKASWGDVAAGDSDWLFNTVGGVTHQYSGVTGNVGIGTTGPGSALEVSGNIETGGLLDNDGSNLFDGSCADNQHITGISSTGAISCGNDSGDISNVTAGNQLTGGGSSGSITLNVSEGSGSGLDADTLDGNDSSAFLTSGDLTYDFLRGFGAMEDWSNGPSNPPDEWSFYNSGGASLGQESTDVKVGAFSVKISPNQWHCALQRYFSDSVTSIGRMQGRTFTFGLWAKATGTGHTVSLTDNAGSSSTAIPNSGAWEWVTVTRTVSSTATSLRLRIWVNGLQSPDRFAPVTIDGAVLEEGTTATPP